VSASTPVAGYPAHAVVEYRRWTNEFGARFTDWRGLCAATGIDTGHEPLRLAGAARKQELCRRCFPWRGWEPAQSLSAPREVTE
jgi:hypothetical protein